MAGSMSKLDVAERDRMRQAAEVLLAARRERAPIADLEPGLRPHSLPEAYALQDVVAEAMGPVGGWKVGARSSDATPMCAPMPLWGGYLESGQTLGGTFSRLRGVEAEIAFLLGEDLPVREAPYTRQEVVAAIAGAHPAIEVLESAFEDPDAADHLSMVGDLQINGGFVYGPPIDDWRSIDLAAETVEVVIDSAVRCETGMANTAGPDLLRLVTWMANEGQARTGGLKRGDWITTGSWVGKLYAGPGSSVLARFSRFGTVGFSFAK